MMDEEIVCPGHGPMERLTYKGVVVRVQCRICAKRPIDLLDESIPGEQFSRPARGHQ